VAFHPLNMTQVITRLMGGLGNQMFQYAAGHALVVVKEPVLVICSVINCTF
jgi:hypothetical protein